MLIKGFIPAWWDTYKMSVMMLSAYNAEIMALQEQKRCGLAVDMKHFAYVALLFKEERKNLLGIKSYMHLPGEDNFLREDTAFKDFAIKGGVLYGKCDKETVLENTDSFVKGFPNEFDVFKFEVATMARVLSDKDLIPEDILYPAYAKQKAA